MAIGVTLEFPGATLDQYDRTCQLMGLTPRGAGPAGLLFHWATGSSDGLLVTDVWHTRERFEEFARDQIGPLSQQAGITGPPKTSIYDVHNYLTSGTLGDTSNPVGIVLEFDNDLAKYDEVLDMMGFTPQGTGADGGLFHWITAIDDGVRITDVWQDRATFDTFAETQIAPYSAKAGVPPARSVTQYDVHNYFTAGA